MGQVDFQSSNLSHPLSGEVTNERAAKMLVFCKCQGAGPRQWQLKTIVRPSSAD
jgi:hypothetical protein